MTSPQALPQNGPVQADALTDLIRAEMQKILSAPPPSQMADPNAPPLTQVAAPATLKVPVGGQIYEFADTAQLGGAIEKVIADAQAAAQAAQVQATQAAQPAQPATVPKGPDLETFVETLKKDPAEGINYALKEKYGIGIEDLMQAAQMMTQTNEAMVAGRFKDLHPEFIPNQQSAAIINQTRQYLGLPYTVDGLEAAYMMSVTRGLIRPDYSQIPQGKQGQGQTPYAQTGQVAQGGQQGQFMQQSAAPSTQQYGLAGFGGGRALPPPNLGGRGGSEAPPDLAAMAEQMTAPQLEDFLRKQGHLFAPGQ